MSKKYQIGEIYISKDGEWSAYWWGIHAEQGGMNFTKGNVSSKDLGSALSVVKLSLEQAKEHLIDKITKKVPVVAKLAAKTKEQQEATILATGSRVGDYRWTGDSYVRR